MKVMINVNQELLKTYIIEKKLSSNSLAILNVFTSFLDTTNNSVKFPLKRFLTHMDINKYTGIGKNTIPLCLDELDKLNLINCLDFHKAGKEIYINPEYCYGEKIPMETMTMFIQKANFKPKKDKFTEKYLEYLLIENLSLIEDGLIYIDNQYEVDNGFIDILAKDKDGTLCIIELKITKRDTKIIEQSVYYPTQFSEKTRMITIAPDYSNKLSKSLNSLGYVEMKTYTIIENELYITNF